MTRNRSALLRAGMLGASLAFSQAAPAAGEIALAHVAPLSGPVTREATEYNAGIRVALKAANAAGGIHGKQLVLRNLDDEYKADTALTRFREAAASDALVALMTVGSPAMTRLLAEQFPETQKFPIIGVIPGAEPLRNPINPYVFHVRAGDLEQYRKLAEHAATTGQQRVAVVYAGRKVEEGPSARLFARPEGGYTRALLSALLIDAYGPRLTIALIALPSSLSGGLLLLRGSTHIHGDLAMIVDELKEELRIYKGEAHPHEAQSPEKLDVAALNPKNTLRG